MRIAIYARKSTESEDRQVQSLDDQINALREIARRENLVIAEVFQEARSAKAPHKRPEFDRLVESIEAGSVDAVLTWSVSRLSRNPVDGGVIAYLLQTGKLSFIRTSERIYKPDDNALLMSIENGMATAYLQDLSRNVKRGMRGKVERGWHCGKAPVGYKNDPESHEIIPDPDRFALVRKGWDSMLSGQNSVSEVHRQLVALGLTVRSRRRTRGPIGETKLFDIFRSRFYLGEITFHGQWLPGKHLPMVTEAEFNAVQEKIGDLSKAKAPVKRRLAFANVFRCSTCGCAVVGERRQKFYPQTNHLAIYTYYHCSGARGCSKRAVTEEALCNAVAPRFLGMELTESTASWLKQSLAESVDYASSSSEFDLKQLDREHTATERRLRQLAVMKMDGDVSQHEYDTLRQELLDRSSELREKTHQFRTQASHIFHCVSGRLDAAVQAGELDAENPESTILSKVMQAAGIHTLTLEPLGFVLDPLLEKITSFEPLRNSSEKPKLGDLVPEFSVWRTFVEELRTLATDQLEKEGYIQETVSRNYTADLRRERGEHGFFGGLL
jgi:site-specific DNA recombinase